MSHDIRMVNSMTERTVLQVEKFEEGGTHVLGGSTDADLNYTYNYGEVWEFIGWRPDDLQGLRGDVCTPKLRELVRRYADVKPYQRDYWAPTLGNGMLVVRRLLAWAEQHPDGYFDNVD